MAEAVAHPCRSPTPYSTEHTFPLAPTLLLAELWAVSKCLSRPSWEPMSRGGVQMEQTKPSITSMVSERELRGLCPEPRQETHPLRTQRLPLGLKGDGRLVKGPGRALPELQGVSGQVVLPSPFGSWMRRLASPHVTWRCAVLSRASSTDWACNHRHAAQAGSLLSTGKGQRLPEGAG